MSGARRVPWQVPEGRVCATCTPASPDSAFCVLLAHVHIMTVMDSSLSSVVVVTGAAAPCNTSRSCTLDGVTGWGDSERSRWGARRCARVAVVVWRASGAVRVAEGCRCGATSSRRCRGHASCSRTSPSCARRRSSCGSSGSPPAASRGGASTSCRSPPPPAPTSANTP